MSKNKEEVTLDLTKYTGTGKREFDENGKLVAIVLTEEQERQHDREYRQYLIDNGILIPALKR